MMMVMDILGCLVMSAVFSVDGNASRIIVAISGMIKFPPLAGMVWCLSVWYDSTDEGEDRWRGLSVRAMSFQRSARVILSIDNIAHVVVAKNRSRRAMRAQSIRALKMRVRRSNWMYLRLARKRWH